MKKTLLACLAIASLSLISCTKEEQEDVTFPITKENAAGTYTITSMMATVNGSAESSVFESAFEECQRDDSYTLSINGSYTINDEGTQCSNARVPQAGTWELKDSKTITIDGEERVIHSFDGSRLVVIANYSANGMTGTVKTTFTKK